MSEQAALDFFKMSAPFL